MTSSGDSHKFFYSFFFFWTSRGLSTRSDRVSDGRSGLGMLFGEFACGICYIRFCFCLHIVRNMNYEA